MAALYKCELEVLENIWSSIHEDNKAEVAKFVLRDCLFESSNASHSPKVKESLKTIFGEHFQENYNAKENNPLEEKLENTIKMLSLQVAVSYQELSTIQTQLEKNPAQVIAVLFADQILIYCTCLKMLGLHKQNDVQLNTAEQELAVQKLDNSKQAYYHLRPINDNKTISSHKELLNYTILDMSKYDAQKISTESNQAKLQNLMKQAVVYNCDLATVKSILDLVNTDTKSKLAEHALTIFNFLNNNKLDVKEYLEELFTEDNTLSYVENHLEVGGDAKNISDLPEINDEVSNPENNDEVSNPENNEIAIDVAGETPTPLANVCTIS